MFFLLEGVCTGAGAFFVFAHEQGRQTKVHKSGVDRPLNK